MADYSSAIDRTGATALIRDQYATEIIQGAAETSMVLRLGKKLPNMSSNRTTMPVLEALASAYFVNGDTGLKQATEVSWGNKYIYAEEIAAIVPIPEAVLADSSYDIWGELRPRLVEAIGLVIDRAILLGTNAPANWPDDILTAATAASQTVDHSSFSGDYYDEILGEGGLMNLVEVDGFMVTGHIAHPTMMAGLRGLRETGGAPIFMQSMQEVGRYVLGGAPVEFVRNGAFPATTALMFTGDWSQLVYSIRQDITYKILDQAVIQDGSGNIIYNLAQQDMVAMRVVMRLGWQLPNPINAMNTNSATRFPFSVLVP